MLYNGTPGNDSFAGGSDNDTANGNGGNDTLTGGVGNDVITGDDGNDSLAGEWGNDTLTGGDGLDTLDGGFGDDALSDSAGGSVMNGGDGFDSLTGGSGADVLNGGTENDWLSGGAAADILTDGEIGNTEADTLVGGTGDDVLISRGGGDSIDGGAGIDSLVLDRTAYAGALAVDVAQMATAEGALLADGTRVSGVDLVEIRSGSGNDTLIGAAAADRLRGGSGNDSLSGGSGHDRLDGEDGDDLLLGGGGNDTLNGGNGIDTVSYANAGGAVSVNLATTTAQATSGGGTDVLSAIENAIGSSFTDILIGTTGANRLDGGTGADTLSGGAGDDTYIVDNTGDVVQEGNNGGIDTIFSSVTRTLSGVGAEVLNLTGSANINGTGNGANNLLTGNSGNNLLDGGIGSDIMAGGAGDDTYIVDSTGDNVAESHLQGTDTIRAGVSYSLFGRAVEILILTGSGNINATGNGLNNTLTGNDGNNVLDGGTGADVMTGGLGDDTYYVDHIQDNVAEQHLQGNDTVYSTITYSLFGRAVEALILTGSAHINATGNSLNNALTGNSGNNILDGGAGADTQTGGAGNDTYYVDIASDVVTEASGGGTDLIISAISYALAGGFVENLTLGGTGNLNATGSGLANTLTGNSGNNVLDGGTGNDTLYGGDGNDTYYVDSTNDRVSDSTGTDLILASATFNLTNTGTESLTLTGLANIDATGNSLDNTLTGNAGNNNLDGGFGNDTMIGGTGDDTYQIRGDDVVVEAAGGGHDTLWFLTRLTVPYVLAEGEVESVEIKYTGYDASVTGNGRDNRLTGNNGGDTLYGLAGNDTLSGGAGFDDLYGGLGNDSLDGGASGGLLDGGEGDDTMVSGGDYTTFYVDSAGDVIVTTPSAANNSAFASISFSLAGRAIKTLTLTGSANINATGHTGLNTLRGNSGNNVLDGGGGTDTLIGGLGNDTYYVDSSSDNVQELAGEGTDTVISSGNYELKSAVENLVLSGALDSSGKGFSNANTITGNSGNNLLDGSFGADTMIGGLGDDTYIVDDSGDIITEAEGEGWDTVRTGGNYTLTQGAIEALVLTGNATFGTGNSRNNALTGSFFDNRLDGAAGDDTMEGYQGNDTYVVDSTGDVVIESSAGDGTDEVWASVSYTLSAFVEKLTLTGTADINGTGNSLSNALNGNDGTNVLAGGQGNDTYLVQNVGDTVVESAGEGDDIVYSHVDFDAGSSAVERIVLAGTADNDAFGNDLSNGIQGNIGANLLEGRAGTDLIEGDAGNDTLDGGAGADTMRGGSGDDVYIVDSLNDVVEDSDYSGQVWSSISYQLNEDGINYLRLLGTADINAYGSEEGGDRLIGNSGNNLIEGFGENDWLDGGEGNDTLHGDQDSDYYHFGLNSGQDMMDNIDPYTFHDKIDISAYTHGVANESMLTQVGYNTFIDLGSGNTITVVGSGVGDVLLCMVW
ncbi:hypothetical protein ABAC460_13565 [Asticcacaulis sp. AC460]|uniref:beta strand repeat-containing protein n=1 Tax=Asticcacaulis sp. AC460 TaxID=1282360 RepID=UPI0003C3E97C|nr:calcium-binding protein [Asticcacaulis sp. AC460]ESQ89092.1 hypothetical protein ABAC460_13565 [Asticcacaulis sp. AC460]